MTCTRQPRSFGVASRRTQDHETNRSRRDLEFAPRAADPPHHEACKHTRPPEQHGRRDAATGRHAMSAESPRQGFRSRLASALKPRKSSNVLRKQAESSSASSRRRPSTSSSFRQDWLPSRPAPAPPPVPAVPAAHATPAPKAPLEAHRDAYRAAHQDIDTQLGERKDHTELLHALGRAEAFESTPSLASEASHDSRLPGEPILGSLSPEVWAMVADCLEPIDAARLAMSAWVLYDRLAPRPFRALNRPENYAAKVDFLLDMDGRLPAQLFCFPCAAYHARLEPGAERLLSTNTQATRPIFACPQARNGARPPPRLPLAPGRSLPFAFTQLAMRRHRHGDAFGILASALDRRWSHEGWQHATRYMVHKGHLLVRITSQTFAAPGATPSAKRTLLFDRADYRPYWSVCAHWKHGDLTAIAKCALDHVPAPTGPTGLARTEALVKDQIEGFKGRHNHTTAGQCGRCKPLRRCTQCPTEYLVQVKLVENKDIGRYRVHASSVPGMPAWKHAFVITRWTDLGDGVNPFKGEWAACGQDDGTGFEGLPELKKRSLAAMFESEITSDTAPSYRLMSLNPRGRRRDNPDDETWY